MRIPNSILYAMIKFFIRMPESQSTLTDDAKLIGPLMVYHEF